MRILGINGSLRSGSYNRLLLQAAAAQLPASTEFDEWTGLATLPAYDGDCDGPSQSPSVVALRRVLGGADAVLIATPEYNHSIPGALKNALDWASRPLHSNPLRGKPVAVVGASTGLFGAVWAQAELKKVLTALGADVIQASVAVPSAAVAFTAEGQLADPQLASDLLSVVCELSRRGLAREAA
jgi:chromate reductase